MNEELPSHTDRFFENTLQIAEFLYDLLVRLNKDIRRTVTPEIIQLGTTFLKSYNRRQIIEGFVKHSHMHWDKIKDQEEEFITANAFTIFSALPQQHVAAFKEIFAMQDSEGVKLVDQKDRDTLWKFFSSFVKISIKFVHDEREPYHRKGNDDHEGQFRYKKKYLPEIDLQYHAKRWDIKLAFPEAT